MTIVRGGVIPAKEHAKLKIEDKVDFILDRMIFAVMDKVPFAVRKESIYRPEDMGPLWIGNLEHKELMVWDGSQINSPKIVWPMDFGFLFHKRNEEWGDHIVCSHFRSIEPRALRGTHARVGRYNILHRMAYLYGAAQWLPSVSVGAWHFGKWIDAGRIGYPEAFNNVTREAGTCPVTIGQKSEPGELTIGELCALGQSMALTYRYEWGAQFSVDNSPQVIIPVTPEGIFELFNDRNKPADRDRRAALRHWVSQHMRKRSGGDFSKVRDYLRGEVKFSWRGFDVTIRPSQFDRERNLDKAG